MDGELLIARLQALGLEQTFDPGSADLIIVNSCGFIQSAKAESLAAVCEARRAYPSAKILLAGCLAERYAQTLKDELPEADAVFGNGNLDAISEVIKPMLSDGRPVVTPAQKGVCCGDRGVFLSFRGSAFVKITEGCDNRCSFCAIPAIRGKLRSRRACEIVEEIRGLVSRGIVEINLIGQDLAAYGTGADDDVFGQGRAGLPVIDGRGTNTGTEKPSALSVLLEQISALSGSFFVRLLYMHPDHFNRDILPVMRRDSRILPYFDIPFQSGDDALIRAMNRRGSASEYARLIADIRRALPSAVFRTTFLTGFPGETEEAAARTREFLSEIKSDWSGCFPYSREENTPAFSMKRQVGEKTAARRAEKLRAVQAELTRRSLAARTDKEYDVLVEELAGGEDGEGLAIGRAWFQAPEVDGAVVVSYDCGNAAESGAVRPGRFVRVRVRAVSGVDLDAVFVRDSELNRGVPPCPYVFAPEISAETEN